MNFASSKRIFRDAIKKRNFKNNRFLPQSFFTKTRTTAREDMMKYSKECREAERLNTSGEADLEKTTP